MDSTVPYRTLQKGEMLNWYRIERILGRGGFGVIYLATDTNLDHPFAIKEYIPGDIATRASDSQVQPITEEHGDMYRWGLDRFIKEARNLVKFNHPNIVRVISVFQQNNTAYMVMEFEEGEELRSYLRRPEGVAEAELKSLLVPVSEGLAEVHRHSFIHRDVKPANILVRKNGSPVLLDFGSARNAGQFAQNGLTALVSVGYAPAEQYNSECDEQQGPWTDIYALGGVAYYAISGKDPMDSQRRGAALYNGGKDPLIPAVYLGEGKYSEPFLRAVDCAMQFRIADRPQTIADWIPALLAETAPPDASVTTRELIQRQRSTDGRRRDNGSDEQQPADPTGGQDATRLSSRSPSVQPLTNDLADEFDIAADASRRQVAANTPKRGSLKIAGIASVVALALAGGAAMWFTSERSPQSTAEPSANTTETEQPQQTEAQAQEQEQAQRQAEAQALEQAAIEARARFEQPVEAARAAIQAGNLEEAAALLRSAESIGIDDPAASQMTAALEADLTAAEAQARADAQKAADEAKKLEQAAAQRAEFDAATEASRDALNAGDPAEASRQLTRARALRTDDPQASQTLASIESELANIEAEAKARQDAAEAASKEFDQALAAARTAIKAGDFAAAGQQLARAASTGVDDPTAIKSVEKELADAQTQAAAAAEQARQAAAAATREKFDQAIAAGSSAIKAGDLKTAREQLDVAKSLRLADRQATDAVKSLEADLGKAQAEVDKAKRLADKARQDARIAAEKAAKKKLDNALAAGNVALEAGKLDEAGKQLERAKSVGIDDRRIARLQNDIETALAEQNRQVSDQDFDKVQLMFDRLKRAIESKDTALVKKLAEESDQSELFAALMQRFDKLNIDIIGVSVRNADKSISATLRIKDMVRANGDRATPSDAYRDREIVSRRVKGEWAKIEW